MNEKVNAQAVAKEPSNVQVPVDPNVPERPIDLVGQAAQYLVDEMARLGALAHDAARCDTGYARAFLVKELASRIETYQSRGLQALVRIVNSLVAEYGKPQGEGQDAASSAT